MAAQAFELTVNFPNNTQPKNIGSWEECNRLKGRHKRWQICRVEADGRRIVMAQSTSFTDHCVPAAMRLKNGLKNL